MVRRQVTLDDVAVEAGVSRSTVWFVLAGKGRVSEKTRAHVRGVADRLQYSVNIGARNLRHARAGAVGVYLPESTGGLSYYMDFIFGVIDVASPNELSVTVLPAGRSKAPTVAHVDGYILIDPPDDDETVRAILQGSLPVVSGETTPFDLPSPEGIVASDHRAGITVLLDHLWDRGARRPALISGPADSAWSRDLRDAYGEWCLAHSVSPKVVDSGHRLTAEDIRRLTTELLAPLSERPDAVVSSPDATAPGAVAAARALNLDVGRDVLIAGYADSIAMEMADPPITAVDLAPRRFGAACARMLLDVMADPDVGYRVETFPFLLRSRASTVGR